MCNRGYDHEDFSNHPYDGRRCKACKQVACGSKPHQPIIHCQHCHRHFYDDRCMALHHEEGICKSWVRCELCRKEYTPSDDPHACYTGRCRAYREDVDLTTHRCYIHSVQEGEDLPVKKPASLYKKQKQKNPHVSRPFLCMQILRQSSRLMEPILPSLSAPRRETQTSATPSMVQNALGNF